MILDQQPLFVWVRLDSVSGQYERDAAVLRRALHQILGNVDFVVVRRENKVDGLELRDKWSNSAAIFSLEKILNTFKVAGLIYDGKWKNACDFLKENEIAPNVLLRGYPLLHHVLMGERHYHPFDENAKKLVQILLRRGAALETWSKHGDTLLQQFAGEGSLAMVNFLVELGADVNALNCHGFTAIELAASRELFDVAEFLFEKSQLSPQALAVVSAQLGKVEFLSNLIREHGLGLLSKEYHDDEPVLLAILRTGKQCVFEQLLNPSVDWSVQYDSQGALHVLAEREDLEEDALIDFLSTLSEEKLKELVGMVDANQNTPLHVAAESIKAKLVAFLIEHGALTDQKNDDDETPLLALLSSGYLPEEAEDIVRLLACQSRPQEIEKARDIALENRLRPRIRQLLGLDLAGGGNHDTAAARRAPSWDASPGPAAQETEDGANAASASVSKRAYFWRSGLS